RPIPDSDDAHTARDMVGQSGEPLDGMASLHYSASPESVNDVKGSRAYFRVERTGGRRPYDSSIPHHPIRRSASDRIAQTVYGGSSFRGPPLFAIGGPRRLDPRYAYCSFPRWSLRGITPPPSPPRGGRCSALRPGSSGP